MKVEFKEKYQFTREIGKFTVLETFLATLNSRPECKPVRPTP